MKKILYIFLIAVGIIILGIIFPPTRYYVLYGAGTPIAMISSVFQPDHKMMSEINYGGYGAECSKPIKVKKERKLVGHMMGSTWETLYLPVNEDEAKLFCHGTWMEEYHGKLTVLQKPEVLELISHYEYKDVNIKALEFELLHSEGFKERLLPQYKDRNIGCIIILETPNEKMVFLEDENLETFEQMDYKLFDAQLDKISPEDKKLFVDNLR